VKYVYDWLKPTLARRYIGLGRVNASERNNASGYFARTRAIIHSQNGNGLVCGLSTRNVRMPSLAQNSTTSQSACHSDGMAPSA